MARGSRPTVLVAAGLALASCSGSSSQVWRDPNYAPAPVHRIYVIAITDANYGLGFENAVAQVLVGEGFEVAIGGAFDPGQPHDERYYQQATARAKEWKVDLLVVQRPSSANCDKSRDPYCMTADTSVYAARVNLQVPIWKAIYTASNFQDRAPGTVANLLVQDLIQARILVK